jgi:hypothetical protein
MARNSALCSEHQVPANHCVALHEARINSSSLALEIGHKISAKLKYWNGPPYNIPEIVDAELQEVREVLLGLTTHALSAGDAAEDHWCKPDGNCSNVCQRARALMEKLEIK